MPKSFSPGLPSNLKELLWEALEPGRERSPKVSNSLSFAFPNSPPSTSPATSDPDRLLGSGAPELPALASAPALTLLLRLGVLRPEALDTLAAPLPARYADDDDSFCALIFSTNVYTLPRAEFCSCSKPLNSKPDRALSDLQARVHCTFRHVFIPPPSPRLLNIQPLFGARKKSLQ